jgi:hypothetical protein
VVCTAHPDEVLALSAAAGIPARVIGHAGGDRLVVDGLVDLRVADALSVWRRALPEALAAG